MIVINKDKVLLTKRNDKLTEIETAYNNEISANINYMNADFQADKDSRELISSTLSGGSVPVGFFWQDINDDRITMNYVELQGLALALIARGQLAFTKLQDIKVQIEACTTVEELELITYG